jgi:hypothetical protein
MSTDVGVGAVLDADHDTCHKENVYNVPGSSECVSDMWKQDLH